MDYREILKEQIFKNEAVRGYKSLMARAAGCQLSYLLQVLKNEARFSADQAILLCNFWEFDVKKTDYFMLLVLKEKATSDALRNYLDEKIRALDFDEEDQ